MCANRASAVTIFDVAERAGVSYSTVSRVVNDFTHVKPTTRAKVQAAMEELGYVANLKARSLAGGRSRLIGVLIYDLSTNYSVEVVRGIDEEVATLDYDMILSTIHHRRTNEADHVANLTRGLVEGLLIVLPGNLEAYGGNLEKQGYPFVLIDHQGLAHGGSGSIQATNFRGSYEATRHLLNLGHQRIGVVTGPSSESNVASTAADRLAGYQTALHEAGIESDPQLVHEGDFRFESGRAGAARFLAQDQPPTAIFAGSDEAAFGVMAAAKSRGLSVPDDLSVVGFDDIPEARYRQPRLTTVHQPLHEMGRLATRMLVEHLEDREQPLTRIELPTSLKIRATTSAPRALD